MMNTLLMLSRFANKTFALWVIIAGILGFVFPDVFKPIGSWIAILLGVMMFGMGLTLTTADFREIFRRPKDVFVGILAQFLIMPLAAFALCKAFALPPDLAVGLMLLGCVPGGTASNLVTFLARGDVALSVTITSCTTLLAPLGDSEECQVGDTVYAIGNPLGVELRGTLTQGIISAIDRPVTMEGRVMTLLQTTAALNNGNSGGPLINEYGQVIGINTLKMSNTLSDISATVEGLGFAVPSSRVVSVINDIIATGGFRGLPSIGVYVKETEFADGTTHPVIDSVTENFGAEEAGLQKGDVILAADGIGVSTNTDLLAVRRTHIVGESVVLTIRRDGQTFDVTVVLYPVEG